MFKTCKNDKETKPSHGKPLTQRPSPRPPDGRRPTAGNCTEASPPSRSTLELERYLGSGREPKKERKNIGKTPENEHGKKKNIEIYRKIEGKHRVTGNEYVFYFQTLGFFRGKGMENIGKSVKTNVKNKHDFHRKELGEAMFYYRKNQRKTTICLGKTDGFSVFVSFFCRNKKGVGWGPERKG